MRQLKEASAANRQRQSSDDSQQHQITSPDSVSSIPLSEKAKGKLPEGSLSRVSSTSSISQQPSMPIRQASLSSITSTASLLPGVKNGFTPTDDWVKLNHLYIY